MMHVPWLSKKRINKVADELMYRYQLKTGKALQPPVPVEDIIERGLGLNIGFEDLGERFGVTDAIGALFVKEKLVLVDNSLVDSEQEGRLAFTFAHEAGHWMLHRNLVNGAQRCHAKPLIFCREVNGSMPMEWQANHFAACLLMPEQRMVDAFAKLYGPDPVKLYNFKSAFCGPLGFDPCVANWPLIAEKVIELGTFSNVSRQAMIIRLQQLGLLQNLSGVKMCWENLRT